MITSQQIFEKHVLTHKSVKKVAPSKSQKTQIVQDKQSKSITDKEVTSGKSPKTKIVQDKQKETYEVTCSKLPKTKIVQDNKRKMILSLIKKYNVMNVVRY